MSLLTKHNRQQLPRLYAQDGKGLDATAYVKLFHPASRFTFYVTEFDGDDQLYGYVVSPLGSDCDELGYSSLAELAGLRVIGLGVERDLHYQPQTIREALVADVFPVPDRASA